MAKSAEHVRCRRMFLSELIMTIPLNDVLVFTPLHTQEIWHILPSYMFIID